jgi:hypothetical protein
MDTLNQIKKSITSILFILLSISLNGQNEVQVTNNQSPLVRKVLFDIIEDRTRYTISCDTATRQIFFRYGNKEYGIDFLEKINAPGKLRLKQDINTDILEVTPTTVYYDYWKTFENRFIVIQPDYYIFSLGEMISSIFTFVLHREDSIIVACDVLPAHNSRIVDFSEYQFYQMWNAYLYSDKNLYITEERLAFYNTGPYLTQVHKIESDTVFLVGEKINNHENFKKFESKQASWIYCRMMQDVIKKWLK